jgi:hypothetical protein
MLPWGQELMTTVREYLELTEFKFPTTIDSTMMNAWKQCELKFMREFIWGLTPHSTSPDLHAGGAIAFGIEVTRKAFYGEKLTADSALAKGIKEFTEFWGDYEAPEKHNKSYERCLVALEAYFNEYPLATDAIQPYMSKGKPAVEYTFAIPLEINNPDTGEPLFYSGRFDMLGIWHDMLWIIDEKTTKSLGAAFAKKWGLRSQFLGYTWASKQHGFDCVGAIVRGIGILKTKIDFMQIPITIPDWMIEKWHEQLLYQIQKMIDVYKSGVWQPNFDEACTQYGGCLFNSLCISKNPGPWYNDYHIRKWDPLAKNPSILIDISNSRPGKGLTELCGIPDYMGS